MEPKHLEMLQHLGLSLNEAKLYLALLNGPQTGQSLSKVTSISRTRVYVDLDILHSHGFVERRDGKVRLYFARQPDLVLDEILVKQEEAFQKTVENVTQLRQELPTLFRPFEDNHTHFHPVSHEHITNLDVYIQKIYELTRNAEISYDHMDSYPIFSRAFDISAFIEVAKRGLHVRLILVDKAFERKLFFDAINRNDIKNLQVRVLPETPCKITIYDRQIAITCSSLNCQPQARRVDVHMASQPDLVAIKQAAFEHYWQKAKTIE